MNQTTTLRRGLAVATLATLGLFLSALTASAAAPKAQRFEVTNTAKQAMTVKVFHDGDDPDDPDKGVVSKTIDPGKSKQWKFNWCEACCGHNKRRTFKVYDSNDTLLASGTLRMSTQRVRENQDSVLCSEDNKIVVTDENSADLWTFRTAYSDNGLGMNLRIDQKSSGDR